MTASTFGKVYTGLDITRYEAAPKMITYPTKEPTMQYDNPLLNQRERTHGDYAHTAEAAQRIKATLRQIARASGASLSHVQAESIDLIATKLARIVSGNPAESEHWKDIAGYANLVSERLIADAIDANLQGELLTDEK